MHNSARCDFTGRRDALWPKARTWEVLLGFRMPLHLSGDQPPGQPALPVFRSLVARTRMELAFHECIATANTTGMIGSTKSTVDLGVAQSAGGAFFDTSPATPGLDELTLGSCRSRRSLGCLILTMSDFDYASMATATPAPTEPQNPWGWDALWTVRCCRMRFTSSRLWAAKECNR